MALNTMSNGKATIGCGTPQERQLEIIDFVRADFADRRLVSVCELEDGTFTLSVENPPSTGRAVHQSIRLGKESFAALLFTAHLFLDGKGMSAAEILKEMSHKDHIDYDFSSGIKSPFP